MKEAVNPAQKGTKCAAHYRFQIAPGASATVRLSLTNVEPKEGAANPFGDEFEKTFELRLAEADQFYARRFPQERSEDAHRVMRQALAGMLWSKQCYHYDVRTWLEGDPGQPPPPPERKKGRNHDWTHLYNADVLSMPDKWEYPWFAAWDLAFHTVALSLVDPDFAKEQLILLLREWYMHPNGQLPAYEWAFGDVNPPVHAWAAWRVYKIEKRIRGRADRGFLERVFHKLLLNFTWWVNRKDPDGMNVFQGGFLGLDNIGVFDRSQPLPTGGHLEQSDGTSWMGMYCLNMLAIALELAREDPAYEDVASKFFEHFVHIADAINVHGSDGIALWDEEDGFFYDAIHLAEWRPALPESALDGRADSAVCRGDARAGADRAPAGLSAAHAMVPGQHAGLRIARGLAARSSPNGVRRLLVAGGPQATGADRWATWSTRMNFFRRTASARCRNITRRILIFFR